MRVSVEFINPFLVSTKSVIETMAFTEITAGEPYRKEKNVTWGVVTGLIGMAGENVSGNMVVSFDRPSILGIVSSMLGEQFEEIDEEVADAVGEITNMISGGAKRELNKQGYEFEMALPVTIIGANTEISQMSRGPIIAIPFETDAGRLVVEANIEVESEK